MVIHTYNTSNYKSYWFVVFWGKVIRIKMKEIITNNGETYWLDIHGRKYDLDGERK